MADLKGLLVEAGKEWPLVVTMPHSQWLELPEEERVYSKEAIQFVADALAGKYKHPRTGRFSPSSMGGCERRMIFSYQGVVGLPDDIDSPDLMGLGSWGHLRWQAEGITRGWMPDCEVWTTDPALNIGGSIDGMLYDDSIFELKTIHPFKYTQVTQVANTPLLPNLLQLTTYELMEGVNFGSLVYEDRSSGQFYEFRHELNEIHASMVMAILNRVNNHVADETLPKMLEPCTKHQGLVFKNCPYRKHCPLVAKRAGEL